MFFVPLVLVAGALLVWMLAPSAPPNAFKLQALLLCSGVLLLSAAAASVVWLFPLPLNKLLDKLYTSRLSRIVLSAFILLSLMMLASSAVLRHEKFLTYIYDLGIMDQTLWNTAHGRPLEFSISHGQPTVRALTGRLELIYLPLALLYRLRPDATTLLCAQSFFLALGALPIYLLAQDKLKSQFAALCFAGAYLMHPAVQGVNLSAFHSTSLAVPMLLFAFYFLERGNVRSFTLAALMALSCREDLAMPLFGLGVYAALAHKRKTAGWGVAFGSLAWFALIMFVIPKLTHAAPSPYARKMLGHLAEGPSGMLRTLVHDPMSLMGQLATFDNLFYLFALLAPFALFSLLRPAVLLTCAPTLLAHLSSGWSQMSDIQSHYAAPLLPAVAASAILGAQRLQEWLTQRALTHNHLAACNVHLLATAIFFAFFFSRPVRPPSVWSERHRRALDEAVRLIPLDASVRAAQHVGPHLSQRRLLFPYESSYDADYVIYDGYEYLLWRAEKPHDRETPDAELLSPFPLAMLNDRDFGLIRHDDEVFVFQRGADYEEGIRQWAITARPSRNGTESVPYEVSTYRARQGVFIDLILYWEKPPAHPTVTLICANDKQRSADILSAGKQDACATQRWEWQHAPTFGVYPVEKWRPGEVVRDHVLIRLYTAQSGERYEIGIATQAIQELIRSTRSPELVRGAYPQSRQVGKDSPSFGNRLKICEVRIP